MTKMINHLNISGTKYMIFEIVNKKHIRIGEIDLEIIFSFEYHNVEPRAFWSKASAFFY